MLEVKIDKIVPISSVRDSLNEIVGNVENSDDLYVITKNGLPTAIIVGVHHLEKLTGMSHEELLPDEPEAATAPAIIDAGLVDNTPTSAKEMPLPATPAAPLSSAPSADSGLNNLSYDQDDIFNPMPSPVQAAPTEVPIQAASQPAQQPAAPVMNTEYTQNQASINATTPAMVAPAAQQPVAQAPQPTAASAPSNALLPDEELEDIFAPDANANSNGV
jgi:prevent-host-death family protein